MPSHIQVLRLLPWLLMAGSAFADEPQWLKDARAREGKAIQAQQIKSQDGFFSAQVMGRLLKEIKEDEETYPVELDIGSESPVNCELLLDGFDAGAMLGATADLTFKQLEPIQGKIEQRAVERTDAGVFGSSPYMATDWLYRVNTGKQQRLGSLKQIVVRMQDHGLYCAHIDLGYSRSFFDAVKSLAETMTFAKPAQTAYYTEVNTATLAGAKVGFAIVTMTRDADGDSKLLAVTSLVMRVTADTLRSQDSVHVQWIRPDGSLINASHFESDNGELGTSLELDVTDDGKWQVKGTFNGKPLEELIPEEAAPASWVDVASERRKAFAQENLAGVQLNTRQWTTADPTRFVESQTTLLSVLDAGRIAAREKFAGIEVEHELDRATGMPVKSVLQIGPASVQLDRVYIQGAF